MSRTAIFACLVLVAGALLAACSPKASPTADSDTVYTQVAGTVNANLTQAAVLTPSATFTTAPTNTVEPTQTAAEAATTPTVETSPQPVYTATRPLSPDRAEYVSQSIADDTKMDPGQQFTLVWKLKNIGTTTWTTSYLLRFYSGAQMGSPATVAFPREVKPNDTVELSVNMTAPSTAGTYLGNFVLTNADGVNFSSVYLQIVVGNPPTATITVVPSATPEATTAVPPTETATNTVAP